MVLIYTIIIELTTLLIFTFKGTFIREHSEHNSKLLMKKGPLFKRLCGYGNSHLRNHKMKTVNFHKASI